MPHVAPYLARSGRLLFSGSRSGKSERVCAGFLASRNSIIAFGVGPAQGSRVSIMNPAPIVLRVVRVGEAGEFEIASGQREAMVARDAPLARVEHVHEEQLAVVLVREVEIVGQHERGR
jgi:hypothetical protein